MRVLSKVQWTYLLLESFLGPIGSAAGIDLDTRAWPTQAFIRRVGAKTTPLPNIPQSDARKSQKRGKKSTLQIVCSSIQRFQKTSFV